MPQVTTTSISAPGRFVLTARQQHLVTDATPSRGGSGEALGAAELLLGALTTCAAAVVTSAAKEENIAFDRVETSAEAEPEPERPNHYAFIRLTITVYGVSQERAEYLANVFAGICPIYGSLSRGAPLTLEARGIPRPA